MISCSAEMLLELDRGAESAAIYRALLKRNPESRRHFAALERALAPATEEERLAIYREYQQLYPRAHAPKKLQLYIVRGGSWTWGRFWWGWGGGETT